MKKTSTQASLAPGDVAITSTFSEVRCSTFWPSLTFSIATSWSLRTAARSNSSSSAASSMRVLMPFTTRSVFPSKNRITWSIISWYSSLSTAPIHGPTHL